MLTWTAAQRTDPGTRRRVNEDALLSSTGQGLWLVADGMGGHAAGDYASQLMVSQFRDLVVRQRSLVELVNEVDDRIRQTNEQLLRYARANNAATVGTTVVVLVLTPQFGFCTWVGDSRLYRVRQGRHELLTRDHSLVQQLVDTGEISDVEADTHPSRNVLLRAVGAGVQVHPSVQVFQPQPGDLYLLCSDGFYHEVHDSVVLDVLQECPPREAVDVLLETALCGGADDNVSLIAIRVQNDPDRTA